MEVLTASDLARELKCSPACISNWMKEGLLPPPASAPRRGRGGRPLRTWSADVRALFPGLRDLLTLREGQHFVRRVDRGGDFVLLDFHLGERIARLRSAATDRLTIVDLIYHKNIGWRPKGFVHKRPEPAAAAAGGAQ